MVMLASLNIRHPNTARGAKGADQERHRLTAEEMRENIERYFCAYGRPLTSVSSFKYLGRIRMASYDDWYMVVGNLQKVWRNWDPMSRILGMEGANTRVLWDLFKAVV